MDVIHTVPSLRLLYVLRPEFKAVVRCVVWWWSVKQNGSTLGQQMMGLSYTVGNSGQPISYRHRWLLLVLTAGPDWLIERTRGLLDAIFPDKERQINDYFKYIASVVQLIKLANFLLFLVSGCYPSLTDRILSLHIKPTRPQFLRSVSSTYMNREILWHGFSEFLFFVLPHINFFAIRNWIQQVLYKWRRYVPTMSIKNNDMQCSWCGHDLVMPQEANCGHLYCYYCISANVCADQLFSCCICSRSVVPYKNLSIKN